MATMAATSSLRAASRCGRSGLPAPRQCWGLQRGRASASPTHGHTKDLVCSRGHGAPRTRRAARRRDAPSESLSPLGAACGRASAARAREGEGEGCRRSGSSGASQRAVSPARCCAPWGRAWGSDARGAISLGVRACASGAAAAGAEGAPRHATNVCSFADAAPRHPTPGVARWGALALAQPRVTRTSLSLSAVGRACLITRHGCPCLLPLRHRDTDSCTLRRHPRSRAAASPQLRRSARPTRRAAARAADAGAMGAPGGGDESLASTGEVFPRIKVRLVCVLGRWVAAPPRAACPARRIPH